ncbi:maleylpyruvate isomerase family mycothiol-dependent enzyme [Nonomuraea phyllanthi]|uniref:maleylpyruvate isomerase family mycothiol-dependent enzyme n=1 Tax=Nonomuraea phyllanthi TaxID=2219224 RepID=UPI00129338F4|nr:maleylpyruvate isomerase family mycothiol-dependent enzyme [Nonomuraea phyllanthi]QFY08798.1 maleylpyruvate isomerase family mycothiol-dependent enzyme [Nonomuraea phyllanthi]
MASTDIARLSGWLREQAAGLARAAAGGDPDAQVPTCPEWSLRTVVGHLGQTYRWTAELLRDGVPLPAPDARQADPGAPDAWERWLGDGAEELIGALGWVGAGTEVWTFTGRRPAWFWLRRMVGDTTIHHYDAAVTTGAAFKVDDDLAADVITEGMELLAAPGAEGLNPAMAELRGNGERLGVRPDSGDGWILTRLPEGLRWERGPVELPGARKGEGVDVVVSGAVADLMLVCTRRLPLDDHRVTVSGDRALLEHWLARMAF